MKEFHGSMNIFKMFYSPPPLKKKETKNFSNSLFIYNCISKKIYVENIRVIYYYKFSDKLVHLLFGEKKHPKKCVYLFALCLDSGIIVMDFFVFVVKAQNNFLTFESI